MVFTKTTRQNLCLVWQMKSAACGQHPFVRHLSLDSHLILNAEKCPANVMLPGILPHIL